MHAIHWLNRTFSCGDVTQASKQSVKHAICIVKHRHEDCKCRDFPDVRGGLLAFGLRELFATRTSDIGGSCAMNHLEAISLVSVRSWALRERSVHFGILAGRRPFSQHGTSVFINGKGRCRDQPRQHRFL